MTTNASTKALCISLSDVEAAMARIRSVVHYTPVMECSHLNKLAQRQLYFKCENFQRTGSFKVRGAMNAVKLLTEDNDDVIVVTHSSGNHAQALSLAANTCGVPAHIVMPNTCPSVKCEAVRGYGGIVTLCEPTEQSRRDTAAAIVEKFAPKAVLVSSSNHPNIMAGQGTISMELLEQVPDLDAIVGSVSGGGFVAGMAVAAKALKPGIKIFAAEPKLADDCARSMVAGRLIANETYPNTICDSLRVSVYDLPFEIFKQHLSAVITVSEEEVVSAMRLVWERMKLVIEPGAACSVAAVLTQQFHELAGPDVKKVGVVLCGGNVDLDKLPWMNTNS